MKDVSVYDTDAEVLYMLADANEVTVAEIIQAMIEIVKDDMVALIDAL